MSDTTVLFVAEPPYVKFYAPLCERLVDSGFTPLWVTLDGVAEWPYHYVDLRVAIETLASISDLEGPEQGGTLCVFERAVFERPSLFKDNYSYTIKTVRTLERARRLARVWYQATLALLLRFRPRAVCLWNGRYLPYSAVSAACGAAGQLLLTSEIGWIPGTIFLDRGTLSTNTTDLLGRRLDATAAGDMGDMARADAFLEDYITRKATMVSQPFVSASEVRRRLLGEEGKFLLLYGCQVDWDTNVVIGARRFRSNEAAVAFLIECLSGISGARLVVKTHPLDSERNDNVLRDLIGDRGTVVSDIHPHALIEAADCVSVRNSTLGFEALCYGKPLLLLEHAKYRDPQLTLEAGDAAEGAASLLSVSTKTCRLPDPVVLRKFILHIIDHYLVPTRYRYFFEPKNLDILSHFDRNQSYQYLEQLLHQAIPRYGINVDDRVLRAVEDLDVHAPRRRSFLYRKLRNVLDRLLRSPN